MSQVTLTGEIEPLIRDMPDSDEINHIRPGRAHKDDDLPVVLYRTVNATFERTHDGRVINDARVQLDVYAETLATVNSISNNLFDWLEGFHGAMDTKRAIHIYALDVDDDPMMAIDRDAYRRLLQFNISI